MRLTTVSTIAVVALLLAGCSGKKAQKQEKEELPLVSIESVQAEDVPQISTYTATVEAFKTNNITTSTPNRIKRILVDVGSRVGAGQRIVILDDVNIEQMKVRIANQKREYERAVELLKIGGGTQQAVDQVRTEYDAARRAYANMVENTVLVSPISGVVTARNYDNGDMTSALPILTIEQMEPVKVLVGVSEEDFPKIKKGMRVKVRLDTYGDEVFAGTVYLVHPTIDPATRTFQVEITIANKDHRVHSGMFARVEMQFGIQRHVVVPDRAVVKQTGSGNKYVYVYRDGKVSYNKVELGQRLDDRYELLSGVEDNAQVVVSGQSQLADGAKVQVVKDAEK